jgi:GntR family negative regulator for fad regulon and positive regulator of fabA
VVGLLVDSRDLDEEPAAFVAFDWRLQHELTLLSGNPVYTLIFNGFAGFFDALALPYFVQAEAREASRGFYASLLNAARRGSGPQAYEVTAAAMRESVTLWRALGQQVLAGEA